MARGKYKISYIKKPFARGSFVCLSAALLAFILCGVSLYLSVRLEGQGGLDVAAWGFSSMVSSLVSLVYGVISLAQKEKNYLFARIGMTAGSIMVLFWICMIMVGLMV